MFFSSLFYLIQNPRELENKQIKPKTHARTHKHTHWIHLSVDSEILLITEYVPSYAQ